MAYLKAVVGAFLAALLLGAATGAGEVFRRAVANIPPEEKATIYAASISEAMNCAAFFILVLVPLAVLLLFLVRWWRVRSARGR
jgi:predicted benzoate:H+ symporter BenE